MRVLITGVAGFMGSQLARWLLENTDHEVVGIDDLSGGYIENVPDGCQFIEVDLVTSEGIDDIFYGLEFDYVFHLAAYAAEGLSPFMRCFNYRQNMLPAAKLITASIKHKVKRFVFTSSMAVYGEGLPPFDETHQPRPIDPYGIAKFSIEQDLAVAYRQHGLDYCIIRPHNVYGPGQNIWDPYRNVLGIWVRKILNDEPLTVYGSGEQKRAFTYIGDIAEPLWRSATEARASRQIINLGGPNSVSINEAAEILMDVCGHGEVVRLPARHEVAEAWCTTRKSVEILGYKHKTFLPVGLKKMLQWASGEPDRPQKRWEEYELWRPEWIVA